MDSTSQRTIRARSPPAGRRSISSCATCRGTESDLAAFGSVRLADRGLEERRSRARAHTHRQRDSHALKKQLPRYSSRGRLALHRISADPRRLVAEMEAEAPLAQLHVGGRRAVETPEVLGPRFVDDLLDLSLI